MENTNKREVRNGSYNNEEEDEMKMEKFYSLLRSFRDARDRRRRELQELEENESKKKKMKTTATTEPKLEASFEWQDFTADIHFRKPPLIFPNPIPSDAVSNNNKGEKKEKLQEHALDLKLAL